jgi:hypothetical protein
MTNAQFSQIVGLLTEIRDALAYLCQTPPTGTEDMAETAPACEHPEEQRIDLSTPRERHWVCQDCGYVERRVTATATLAPAVPGADAKE